MTDQQRLQQGALTGRIQASPETTVHKEILAPQFNYELQHLLPEYIWIEQVLLIEYQRLDLLRPRDVVHIGAILGQITPESLIADPRVNMSDIAFAIERHVQGCLDTDVQNWHVDRSRNDLQACAQVMFGREQVLVTVDGLLSLARAVYLLADRNTQVVMPGYTHYQMAQVISPAFYLGALLEQILQTLRRLQAVYDEMNVCPLGAGAMAGQELPWDRDHMAHLLGFDRSQRHALVAVASREWILWIAAELSAFAVALSRFMTDFMTWGSSEYGFIDLPDELAGISSAMPQKKNFTLLERIRGKTAHISGFYMDFVLGQRNTPFTNLVEVSKEAGSHLMTLFETMQLIVRLLTTVIKRVQIQEERMKAACEREYLGGFALANFLTLHRGIPYRTAQVITGRYIALLIERQQEPSQAEATVLREVCQQHGYDVDLSQEVVQEAFSVERNLYNKSSSGSTSPERVRELLTQQLQDMDSAAAAWHHRRAQLDKARQEVATLVDDRQEGEKVDQ